ncbi:MAG: choice-of-anchor D domain-containing protein [Dehalococcoidia bacterium]
MKKLSVILILALLVQIFAVTTPSAAAEPNIDLAITKIGNPDPVIAGNDITYTIQIVNNGADTASDVYVFDMYPTDSLAVQSTDPSQGTVGLSLPQWVLDTIEQELGITTLPPGYSYLTWQAGNLAPGATANLTIVATVNPDSGECTIINRALAMTDVDDSYWDDNYTESQTSVEPAPPEVDLAISKVADSNPVTAGGMLTYTVTVSNNGPDEATGITVTDTLPAGTAYQSSAASDGSAGHAGGVVTWTIPSLSSGASATLTIVVTAPSEAGIITNNASVTGNEADTNPGNNSVSLNTTVEVQTEPDILVSPSVVTFGTVSVGYTTSPVQITVTNTGNADLVLGTVTSSNGQFSISGPGISGQTLAPGASAGFNIVFTPASDGLMTGSLSITSNDPDENPATVLLYGFGSSTLSPETETPTTVPTTTPNGAEPVPTRFFTVDFLGVITTEPASEDGRPLNDVTAFSPGGVHLLEIGAGTRASDSAGNSVTTITIRETQSPELPLNTALVGTALEFMPTGTSFDGEITLRLGYNVEDLPDEVISVGMAYYESGFGWKYLNLKNDIVAEVGELEAALSHFTVFAILAQVPAETLTTGQLETPTPDVTLPASFILNNLSIETSESKTWHGFTFIARYGENAEVTIDITNTGGESGEYQAILFLNGEPVQSVPFDIGDGETKQIAFNVDGNEPGDYTVRIGNLSGEFSSWVWINWWLISGMIVVVILLGVGAFFLIRRRVRGY